MAVVQTDVAAGDEVVEPVAHNFSDDGCDNGSKVEVADLCGTEVVKWSKEDRECSIDADDPGEGQEVVDCGNEDNRASYNFDGAHKGLGEGVP